MNSLISIIVPVYNSEKALDRCINSILEQTFQNWELLLINDGSTDRSREICDEYAAKDQRIKVFHKTNGGVSSARNVGLDNAKGEWITFCDSDDEILNNTFALYDRIINEHNEIDLISCGYLIYYKSGSLKKSLVRKISYQRIKKHIYLTAKKTVIMDFYETNVLEHLLPKEIGLMKPFLIVKIICIPINIYSNANVPISHQILYINIMLTIWRLKVRDILKDY